MTRNLIVEINLDTCKNCGYCQYTSPKVFEQGENGRTRLVSENTLFVGSTVAVVPVESQEETLLAIEECPNGALRGEVI
jgi:ferredoxin